MKNTCVLAVEDLKCFLELVDGFLVVLFGLGSLGRYASLSQSLHYYF